MNYSKDLLDDFYLYTNYFLVFSLPFPKIVFNIALGFWMIAFLLNKFSKRKVGLSTIKEHPIAWSMVLIYLITLSGLLYTDHLENGKAVVERYLFLIIAPLFLVDLKKLITKDSLKKIYGSFIIGCLVFLVYTFVNTTLYSGVLDLIANSNESAEKIWDRVSYVYTYQRFTQYGGSHAVYLTSYLIFAFFLVLELLKQVTHTRVRRFLISCIFIFSFFMFTLQSAMLFFVFAFLIMLFFIIEKPKVSAFQRRSICGVLFAISAVFLLIKTNIEISSGNGLLIILSTSVIGVLTPSLFPFLKKINVKPWMVIGFIVFSLGLIFIGIQSPRVEQFAKENPSNVSARYWKWKSAVEIIGEQPFLGTGTGDTQLDLREKYEVLAFESGLTHNYNEHNQYLRFWMESGILTLIVFLIWIYFIFKKQKSTLYFPILVIGCLLVFFSFTESELCRRSGVTFFSFFLILFAYIPESLIKRVNHE